MSEYIEESLRTPVAGRYDVIVCGGGPAGIGAAVMAARGGAKTLLIEQYGFLGGMWTAGLVNPFFDTEEKDGLVREIVDKLKAQAAWGAFMDICFDYETMKLLLDDLCREAGVQVLLHTALCVPIMEGSAVHGVIVENKSGRQAFTAPIVIDCTGDGDIAARAGAEVKVGREEDNGCQPMTLMFLLGNIEYMQQNGEELFALMKQAVETYDTGYTLGFQRPFIIQVPKGRYAVVQLTHIRGKSGLDAFSLTEAEQIGRRMVMDTYHLFKNYIPQFKDVDLVATAPQIGVRESRRIMGDYVLTKEDILNRTEFPDGVVTVRFGIDIHNPADGSQQSYDVQPYQIPYRCLLPRGLEGILVAGRCISGEFEAHASYRVTGDCLAMGAAAGAAAAIAIADGTDLRHVDISKIQRTIQY